MASGLKDLDPKSSVWRHLGWCASLSPGLLEENQIIGASWKMDVAWIDAGVPSFFGFGKEGGHTPTFLASTAEVLGSSGLRQMRAAQAT